MAILGSRRLHEPLIERFALRDYDQADTRDAVLGPFARDFSARQDKKSSTISIAYTHRDPQVAADVTHAAADLLKATFNEINQSTAVRKRIFLEGRLQATEAELLRAAKDLADFQSQKGAIEIESQTKASIEAVARFQGELWLSAPWKSGSFRFGVPCSSGIRPMTAMDWMLRSGSDITSISSRPIAGIADVRRRKTAETCADTSEDGKLSAALPGCTTSDASSFGGSGKPRTSWRSSDSE